jgi:hypothetical protein
MVVVPLRRADSETLTPPGSLRIQSIDLIATVLHRLHWFNNLIATYRCFLHRFAPCGIRCYFQPTKRKRDNYLTAYSFIIHQHHPQRLVGFPPSGKTQFGNYLELGHITQNSCKSGFNQVSITLRQVLN